MIPNPEPAVAAGKVAVQANGLPEGVKILDPAASLATSVAEEPPQEASSPEPPAKTVPGPDAEGGPAIIRPRHRLHFGKQAAPDGAPGEPAAEAKPEPKRKRGRPKAGRLDVAVAPATDSVLPEAPAVAARPATLVAPIATPIRRMSDISPRQAPKAQVPEPKHRPPKGAQAKSKRFEHTIKHKGKAVHKVGVAPLHYGQVLGNTLRAHSHKNYLFWGLVTVGGFALAMAYAAWLYFTVGPKTLAAHLASPGLMPILELATLAVLYYIGRSIGQTAIMYGVIRHADERPISLARQFGVAVNSFGRRLRLDVACGILNVAMIGLIALLIVTGGTNWPVSNELQLVALFCAFLFLLYIMSALAMSRGLANVALTTTTQSVWQTVKLGWRLFSHRFELLGFRFLGLAIELLICLPLAALALVILIMAPPQAHLLAILGIALIAVASGTLMGVGTAAWWASLYRRIVLTDRGADAVQLLASRQPNEAKRGSLAVIVMAATLLVCLAVALPWLKFV